jgi:alpha-L-fucosidase 2
MTPRLHILPALLIFLLLAPSVSNAASTDEFSAKDQTLVWHSPGLNSLGSMPLGNGDIGLNVWVEKNGDLVFYIAKSDAWCENGRLVKLGRVRVSISPPLFRDGNSFRQTLDLKNGCITISTKNRNAGSHPPGQGSASRGDSISVRLWVDALNPAIVTEIQGNVPLTARVMLEVWRRNRRQILAPEEMHSAYGLNVPDGPPVFVEPDSILPHTSSSLIWFHRNRRSVWKDNLVLQGLDSAALSMRDPLLHRTFGGTIEGPGLRAVSDTVLQTSRPQRQITFSVYPYTSTDRTPEQWLEQVSSRSKGLSAAPLKTRFEKHRTWWKEFWSRSSIIVTSRDPALYGVTSAVTRGYMLQRFANACAGRGAMPIKFNGTLFTVDTYDRKDATKGFDADFRQWGDPYWFQNTRLPYWTMLQAGDLDLMTPLFATYLNALPLRTYATRRYYGHEGAFYPETMNFWGTYTDANYGPNRTGMPDGLTTNTYIRYYWTAGLELSLMMLDRAEFHWSTPFVRDTLLPVASSVLTFFNRHWPRDSAGTIRFEPAQALETYQVAVNPSPDIAGIRAVAERMLALPLSITTGAQRAEWTTLLNSLPPIPLRIAQGDTLLAPAAEYEKSANIENPELYAIFPFRLFGIRKENLELARRSYSNRVYTMNGGWQQHAIQAAYLGLAEEAALLVAENFGRWDSLCRFPAFWGPNYDWTPDQDHGSVATIALQRMLLQYEGKDILLLPAWPKGWDADFRLHAPGETVVEGRVRAGKMGSLRVTPGDRRKDVHILNMSD